MEKTQTSVSKRIPVTADEFVKTQVLDLLLGYRRRDLAAALDRRYPVIRIPTPLVEEFDRIVNPPA